MKISRETRITPSLSRRQTLAALGATTALAAIPTVAFAKSRALSAQDRGAELLDDVAWNLLRHEPERATVLGVDIDAHSALRGKLEKKTRIGQSAYAETLDADLKRIRAFDTSELDDATRTSFEVVESAYSTALDGFALPYGDIAVGSYRNAPYVVIQNVGSYIDLPRFLDVDHPIRTQEDVESWIERLHAIPHSLHGEIERMQSAAAIGVVPPDFLLDKAILQMEQTIRATGAGELFIPALRERISDAGLDTKPVSHAQGFVKGPVTQALARQLDVLKQQRTIADSDPGMWSQPRGDEWYDWALRASTTTPLSANEVHEQGLEELEALHARMDPILRKIGYTSGSVGERMAALGEDPRYKFAEGDEGRAEIMAFIQDRIDWIRAQMPRAFRTLAQGNVEVRRLPLAEEPGAPGAYGGSGSKDGTVPGKMWINLRSTDLHRKYDLADLTYHETIPGHVWEGEYSNTLPLIRSILAFNAFSEGWALYAEQLADELGAYDDYEVGRLGYLQSLSFRACRMVVDTGLHSKQWSRQQAIDFFVQRNGSKPEEVASEVDRYCSWPGQACGYKLGHSQIDNQRSRAIAGLGGAYDLRDFDDAVVLGGNAPLDVMAKNVTRYINKNKS